MNKVDILIKGATEEKGEFLVASSTIALIRGEKNIIVDTGNNGQADLIVKRLNKFGLEPKDISIVVNTHHHPDHTWNNYLFPHARFYFWRAFQEDMGYSFFTHRKPIELMGGVELIHTPGHSRDDCSVIVQTSKGVYAIVGDLITDKNLSDDKYSSLRPKSLKKNQKKVLKMADFIVPGHGSMFKS